MFCPICGSRSFRDHGKRPNTLCTDCGSLERHRVFGLFLIEMHQQFQDKSVYMFSGGGSQLLSRRGTASLSVTNPSQLRSMSTLDVLLLCHHLPKLDRPLPEFFDDMRRKISDDGLIAFTYSYSGQTETYQRDDVDGEPGKFTEHLGTRAIEWLSLLPGWSFAIWRPEAVFGPDISAKANLRYREPDSLRGISLVVARPV